MPAKYQAILTGFDSIEQAQAFLKWFAQIGEQDPTIAEVMGVDVHTDANTKMVYHPSGVEARVNVEYPEEMDLEELPLEDKLDLWGDMYPPEYE